MEKEVKLKSIDPISFGALGAILYGLIGLFYGFIIMVVASIGTTFAHNLEGGSSILSGIGIAGIVLFPLIFAIMGFIGGLIGALIMNLGLAITKGLKINIEE